MSVIKPELLERANEAGIRLEIVRGIPTWEAAPALRHQVAVREIENSIRRTSGSACACVHAQDVYVRFPDGSIKRPDISIWCREPTELDEAVTLVPEAVIEVVSAGYEAKDYELGPAFYFSQGVKDVVVVDPIKKVARRYETAAQYLDVPSPTTLDLHCGCTVTV